MEEEKKKKRPLDLDWDTLLPRKDDDDDDPPPVLVVTTGQQQSPMGTDQQQQQHCQRDDIERMTDGELNETIRRQTMSLQTLAPKLPDKGAKLRLNLKRLEDEREHRKLCRLEKDDGCEKPTESKSSSFIGASNDFRQEAPSSQAHSQSSFASHFCRKLEENIDCRTVNAFDKELSYLGRCNHRKMRLSGQFSQKGRQKTGISLRQSPFQCPSSFSLDGDKHILSNGNQKGRDSSTVVVRQFEENLSSCFSKKRDASQVLPSNDSRPRNGQNIVLVDEEESQLIEATQQADKLAECMKETKIYYPSRDDPESVEIHFSDIKCLDPETYLSSTIMNFYIRHGFVIEVSITNNLLVHLASYLQQPASSTYRTRCDYHFFNTYFYKKLKEAVATKGSNKETFFVKFRRWWKGVNIFLKAYILLPIHEDHHWSLVIICIPDKEDESGPIILHLDSLGFHNSKSIFDNIKSYLKEEWNYLNQGVAPPDLPIADKIWKHFHRRIDEKIIAVPQQKNDYDCGLFVLFFMERFIEEASERLKKKDLAMFGKQWFRPEEASGLRRKIRNILMEEFQNAREDNCIVESLPSSSAGALAESIGHHKDS